jgi:hypothetical protein
MDKVPKCSANVKGLFSHIHEEFLNLEGGVDLSQSSFQSKMDFNVSAVYFADSFVYSALG